MRVVVAPLAAQDIEQAYAFIARDNPEAADRELVRIMQVIELVASGLVSGSEVVLRDGRSVRSWPVPPYRLYYRTTTEELQVVRVYHQSRRPIERGSP